MIRPIKVFTSVFTDSRHQINVRYHTSKLLNQPPSPHPMIRDRKFLAKMKNTFFSNDDPRKKRFHVGWKNARKNIPKMQNVKIKKLKM